MKKLPKSSNYNRIPFPSNESKKPRPKSSIPKTKSLNLLELTRSSPFRHLKTDVDMYNKDVRFRTKSQDHTIKRIKIVEVTDYTSKGMRRVYDVNSDFLQNSLKSNKEAFKLIGSNRFINVPIDKFLKEKEKGRIYNQFSKQFEDDLKELWKIYDNKQCLSPKRAMKKLLKKKAEILSKIEMTPLPVNSNKSSDNYDLILQTERSGVVIRRLEYENSLKKRISVEKIEKKFLEKLRKQEQDELNRSKLIIEEKNEMAKKIQRAFREYKFKYILFKALFMSYIRRIQKNWRIYKFRKFLNYMKSLKITRPNNFQILRKEINIEEFLISITTELQDSKQNKNNNKLKIIDNINYPSFKLNMENGKKNKSGILSQALNADSDLENFSYPRQPYRPVRGPGSSKPLFSMYYISKIILIQRKFKEFLKKRLRLRQNRQRAIDFSSKLPEKNSNKNMVVKSISRIPPIQIRKKIVSVDSLLKIILIQRRFRNILMKRKKEGENRQNYSKFKPQITKTIDQNIKIRPKVKLPAYEIYKYSLTIDEIIKIILIQRFYRKRLLRRKKENLNFNKRYSYKITSSYTNLNPIIKKKSKIPAFEIYKNSFSFYDILKIILIQRQFRKILSRRKKQKESKYRNNKLTPKLSRSTPNQKISTNKPARSGEFGKKPKSFSYNDILKIILIQRNFRKILLRRKKQRENGKRYNKITPKFSRVTPNQNISTDILARSGRFGKKPKSFSFDDILKIILIQREFRRILLRRKRQKENRERLSKLSSKLPRSTPNQKFSAKIPTRSGAFDIRPNAFSMDFLMKLILIQRQFRKILIRRKKEIEIRREKNKKYQKLPLRQKLLLFLTSFQNSIIKSYKLRYFKMLVDVVIKMRQSNKRSHQPTVYIPKSKISISTFNFDLENKKKFPQPSPTNIFRLQEFILKLNQKFHKKIINEIRILLSADVFRKIVKYRLLVVLDRLLHRKLLHKLIYKIYLPVQRHPNEHRDTAKFLADSLKEFGKNVKRKEEPEYEIHNFIITNENKISTANKYSTASFRANSNNLISRNEIFTFSNYGR